MRESGKTPAVKKEKLNQLSHQLLGFCLEVHRELGPGLLESAYEEALAFELTHAALGFERQRPMPFRYKQTTLDCGYRVDFYFDDGLIIELKSVAELLPVHQAQLLTYLKLADCSLGLLINFNVPAFKDGIRRVVIGNLFES